MTDAQDPAPSPSPAPVPAPPPLPPPPAARPRFPRRALAALAVGAGLLLLYGVFLMGRGRLPALDGAALAAARARWAAAACADYRLRLTTEASTLARGAFVIEVRAGAVVAATRDGVPTTGDTTAYTVPGLFTLMRDELALAENPQRSYGAPEGFRAYLFADFDPKYGVPVGFRRIVGGNNKTAEFRVLSFEPLPPGGK
ncbi:MAG: hypothetical protein HZA54_01585 [Planctomycetes bacterium]|nr:hypothetical protein [Planctomycetota bacterium]